MAAVGILLLECKVNIDMGVSKAAVTFINVQQIYEDQRYSNRVKGNRIR